MDTKGTKDIEINRGDLLAMALCRAFCSWANAQPMDYQHWLNQLLPLEEGDKIVCQAMPIEIECSCLLQSTINALEKQLDVIDSYLGTALGELIKVLKIFTFVNASRQRGMEDGEALWWSIKRQDNLAWFVERDAKADMRSLF